MKMAFFLAKSVLRRSQLSRASRAPSRRIRPRPIDCDGVPKPPVKISWFLANFFSNIAPKKVFYRVPDLVLIYTPKEAHSRKFWGRGVSIRATRGGVLGATSLYCLIAWKVDVLLNYVLGYPLFPFVSCLVVLLCTTVHRT